MTKERFSLQGQKAVYHVTIGLEVHAQIASRAKLFSSAPTAFGAAPNTQVTFVDAGFPGMLPVLNKKCVEQAAKTSLGLRGTLNKTSYFDRKNYFYPDLPQGYQITQFYKPIMEKGHLTIFREDGTEKVIRVNRLHIEQDAGKSLHDRDPNFSVIDLNRAGVGLMEIVSEPDLFSPEEAGTYVRTLRNLLVTLGTSDGNMEEGSLRVDANVSVAPIGDPLGTRVEIKNLNSVRFMQQAILYEAQRQISALESGNKVAQETRLYDTIKKETRAMRSKEDAQEYRYFPDPDLPPLVLDDTWVEELTQTLPELPDDKRARLQKETGLSLYDISVLMGDLSVLAFFEKALSLRDQATPKALANWVMSDFMAAANRLDGALNAHHFSPQHLVGIVEMVATDTLSGKMAKVVFEEAWETGEKPAVIVEKKGLVQISSTEELLPVIDALLEEEKQKVAAYKGGQEKLFGYFVGQLMKRTKGQANPGILNKLLKERLS